MSENFKISPRSRKYEGLAPLTKDITQLTQHIFGAHGFVGIDLIAHWTEIVGEELSFGVLHVRTAGGTFALLFEHQKNRVIDRVNTYFGYPAVSEIRIVQGAVKLPKQEATEIEWPLGDEEVQEVLNKIDLIEDDALRAKAFELGVAMIRKRKHA